MLLLFVLLAANPMKRLESQLNEKRPLNYALFVEAAKQLGGQPYSDEPSDDEELLDAIDYDAHQGIRFRPEASLLEAEWKYPVQLFHPGKFFKQPVSINILKKGVGKPVTFQRRAFEYKDKKLEKSISSSLGYAGFRLMEKDRDWLVFLGASYFRTPGALQQYGLSARGLAIDTGLNKPEEFPRFRWFWIEQTSDPEWPVTIYAILDSPSVTGAYQFKCAKREGVFMQVHAHLVFRKAVERVGIAPLTSMYWFSEANHSQATDWRPEVHDSDGLALWTGAGERLLRPLTNPPRVMTNSFSDESPKGFGLVQRDRSFEHYEDDGVWYDKRPTLWVEPVGQWGKGAVQLVEIPTDDEIFDNVVAYWVPSPLPAAGEERDMEYVLHWVKDEPSPAIGRVMHTRLGRGGIPGQPRPPGRVKFVVDFEGGPLEALLKADKVEPVITLSRGKVTHKYTLQIVGTKRWRAVFDVQADEAAKDPVDMRMYLRKGAQTLTETWLYQYHYRAALAAK